MEREGLYRYDEKEDDDKLLNKICKMTLIHGVLFEIMKAKDEREEAHNLQATPVVRRESQRELLS